MTRHPSATRRFGGSACEICGETVTINGRGRASHMDAHVRRKEARIVNLEESALLMKYGLDPLPYRYEKVEKAGTP